MGDIPEELKKRPNNDLFGPEDFALNFGNKAPPINTSVPASAQAESSYLNDPIQELKDSFRSNPKPVIKPISSTSSNLSSTASNSRSLDQDSLLNPNPYEEKFHSEFSFIAFVLGIFGLILPLFSPLAIIFGIGGLMQTHRERMKGRWMALAGIALGFLGIMVMIIAIISSINFLEDYLLRMGGIETLMGNFGN